MITTMSTRGLQILLQEQTVTDPLHSPIFASSAQIILGAYSALRVLAFFEFVQSIRKGAEPPDIK